MLALVWPEAALTALVVLFGVYVLVDGLALVAAAVRGGGGGQRWLLGLQGLVGLLAAAVAVVSPHGTAVAAVYLFGAWALLTGLLGAAVALRLTGVVPGARLLGVGGVLSVVLGVLLLRSPDAGAHSYGGAVITNAATGNPNVTALVYVAAFIPDAGEKGADLLRLPGGLIVVPPSPEATVAACPFPGGLDLYVNAGPFREIFAADLPAEETALMAAAQRPLAAAAFTDASGPPAWKTIPSWALVATRDNTIGTANTRFMANRAAPSRTVEVAAAHAVLLSQPQAVVDLIGEAVRGV